MRIVGENSEAEIARQRAMDRVDRALRDLTANLMRVTRGAGKPHEIGRQAAALVEALIAYDDTVGRFPSPEEMTRVLTVDEDPDILDQISSEERARVYAVQSIIWGSLQIAASRLLGQRTQEAAGKHELYDGVRDLEEIREQQRKKWAATRPASKNDVGVAIRGARTVAKARSIKSKPKA